MFFFFTKQVTEAVTISYIIKLLQVAEIIKEDLWPSPLSYFNTVIDLFFVLFSSLSFLKMKLEIKCNFPTSPTQDPDDEDFDGEEGDEEVNDPTLSCFVNLMTCLYFFLLFQFQ